MDECDNECDTEMVSLDSLLLLQCVEFLKYLLVLVVNNFNCHLWLYLYIWAIKFLGLISYFGNRLTILSTGNHVYCSWVYVFLAVKIKFCIVSTQPETKLYPLILCKLTFFKLWLIKQSFWRTSMFFHFLNVKCLDWIGIKFGF